MLRPLGALGVESPSARCAHPRAAAAGCGRGHAVPSSASVLTLRRILRLHTDGRRRIGPHEHVVPRRAALHDAPRSAHADGAGSDAEHLAGGVVVHAVTVHQHDGRPVTDREVDQGGGRSARSTVSSPASGPGGRAAPPVVVGLLGPAPAATELVEADVADDPVQPSADGGVAAEPRKGPGRRGCRPTAGRRRPGPGRPVAAGPGSGAGAPARRSARPGRGRRRWS